MQVEDRNKIAFKLRVEEKEYRSEIRNYLWNILKDLSISEEIIRPKRFGNGKTMTFAEIRGYKTKYQLYKGIDLGEKGKNHLDCELIRLGDKCDDNFDFYAELLYFLDDIFIIDGVLPEEKVDNNIILIVNIIEEDLRKFLRESQSNNIYIFSDEKSLYEFRDCLLRSKCFLEFGFNMSDINNLSSSKDHSIKILSYFYGTENLDKTKLQMFFINEDNGDVNMIKNYISDKFSYVLRDDILDRDIDGFNIEIL